MDACECSGGARAGSLRPERHTRKPRAPYGAAEKRSSQRSHNPVRGKKGKRRVKEWGKKEIKEKRSQEQRGGVWGKEKAGTEEGGGKERGGRG
ncbi:hypothetical protein NDU88_005181 [Pleurodeles waltl]|uniref:Uncharacterized protein n=1 Tax=Pleurodeles waltl TaxID=8319 RepID=A0AAV7M980_PLEWA|nr:hypothetical protein NDU88_005181 [Pleurodeles waltl]